LLRGQSLIGFDPLAISGDEPYFIGTDLAAVRPKKQGKAARLLDRLANSRGDNFTRIVDGVLKRWLLLVKAAATAERANRQSDRRPSPSTIPPATTSTSSLPTRRILCPTPGLTWITIAIRALRSWASRSCRPLPQWRCRFSNSNYSTGLRMLWRYLNGPKCACLDRRGL
jgi:hypothetical protein